MTKDDIIIIREIAEIAGEMCEMRDDDKCLTSTKRCRECDLTRTVAYKIFERCFKRRIDALIEENTGIYQLGYQDGKMLTEAQPYAPGGRTARRPRVFICSPYRAATVDELERNRKYAASLVRRAVKGGYAPYAPHLYLTNALDDKNTAQREAGMSVGLSFLDACDRVFVGAKYGITEGMRREIDFARKLGKTIVTFAD